MKESKQKTDNRNYRGGEWNGQPQMDIESMMKQTSSSSSLPEVAMDDDDTGYGRDRDARINVKRTQYKYEAEKSKQMMDKLGKPASSNRSIPRRNKQPDEPLRQPSHNNTTAAAVMT